jgi:hypothetical protein
MEREIVSCTSTNSSDSKSITKDCNGKSDSDNDSTSLVGGVLDRSADTNDGSIICDRGMSGSIANGESNGKKRKRSTTRGSSGILGSRIVQDVEQVGVHQRGKDLFWNVLTGFGNTE